MARYPTFEEYDNTGNHKDGLKRTTDLLAKSPKDIQLLTLQLQFLSALKTDQTPTLDFLLAIQPPIQDLNELVDINDAIVSAQRDDHPSPTTAGPTAAKFWDNAIRASATAAAKLDLLSLRFARAITHQRLLDAQQSLIQLKALASKNRTVYMAHAAVTQLLATAGDDMPGRLALGLARKAVKEGFDGDAGLDCRVVGQIFAAHGSEVDLEGIRGRGAFGESKQVYEALRRKGKVATTTTNGEVLEKVVGALKVEGDEVLAEVLEEKRRFAELVKSGASLEDVLAFTYDAIRLFSATIKASSDDRRRTKADSCFLSISGLVQAFSTTKQPSYLLNAAYLAETLLIHNEHVHEARMVLVYLYMRLGLGSLAIRMFKSLNVKEIQNDTVGHVLFTRISLIHPFATAQASKKEAVDPSEMARNAVIVYLKSERKLADCASAILSHGQTGMLFDLQEMRRALDTSVARRIIILEQRRLDRLTQGGTGEHAGVVGSRFTANWLTSTDNRDFKATFDFGLNVEKVLHGYEDGMPGRDWILRALMLDSAWCLALNKEAPVLDIEELLQTFDNLESQTSTSTNSQKEPDNITPSEAEHPASSIACRVVKLLAHLKTDDSNLEDDIATLRQDLSKISIPPPDSQTPIFTENLIAHHAYIDIIRTVEKARTLASKTTSEHKAALSGLCDDAERIRNALRASAKRCKDAVKAAQVRAMMLEDGETAEVMGAFGEKALTAFCESVAASAKEGWDGVGKIRCGP